MDTLETIIYPLRKSVSALSPMQMDATLLANNSQHCWMLHVASSCTSCCIWLEVVAQAWNRSNFWANNSKHFLCSVITKHSTTMLDRFVQLFQHCWAHTCALHMVYNISLVASFPLCVGGPHIVGSSCIQLHTTADTEATNPNFVGRQCLFAAGALTK